MEEFIYTHCAKCNDFCEGIVNCQKWYKENVSFAEKLTYEQLLSLKVYLDRNCPNEEFYLEALAETGLKNEY